MLNHKFYLEDLKEGQYIDFIKDVVNASFAPEELIVDSHNPNVLQSGGGFKHKSSLKLRFEIKDKSLSIEELMLDQQVNITLGRFPDSSVYNKFIVFFPYYLNDSPSLIETYKEKVKNTSSIKLNVEVWDLSNIDDIISEHPELLKKYIVTTDKWYYAYNKLALCLANNYQLTNEKEHIAENIFNTLKNTKFGELNRKRLFRPDLNLKTPGLDPLQIFAAFNYSRVKNETQIESLNSLLKTLGSLIRVSTKTKFEGIPTPIITSIIQFRDNHIQQQIWQVFHDVLKSPNNIKGNYFEELKHTWKGIEVASFTMFLFWIDSSNYLPFDTNTTKFLNDFYDKGEIPPTFKKYYKFCFNKDGFKDDIYHLSPRQRGNLFREIVLDAYNYYDRGNQDFNFSGTTESHIIQNIGSEEEIEYVIEEKKERRKNIISSGFKILGIRLRKSDKTDNNKRVKYEKNLQFDVAYNFYHSYSIDGANDKQIKHEPNLELDIYNSNKFGTNISAIVGENGTGKSSLLEVIFLIFNKLAIEKNVETTVTLDDESVYADLYVKLDDVYKITVGANIEVYKYEFKNEKEGYLRIEEDIFESFNINNLCYNIAVNYSMYGLNTRHHGEWIDKLFHKNDGYRVPAVLNPQRKEGNIDINKEEDLAKARMLANLLNPEGLGFDEKEVNEIILPDLLPNTKPEFLQFSVNHEKLKRKREEFYKRYDNFRPEKTQNLYKDTYNKVGKIFDTESVIGEGMLRDVLYEYAFLKLTELSNGVDGVVNGFSSFSDLPNHINEKRGGGILKKFIKVIKSDRNHITLKIRQLDNFINHQIYEGEQQSLKSLMNKIYTKKLETGYNTVDLIPPSIFKTNVIFEHGGSFDELSSGQKQKILSINTITYHLYNLSTVAVNSPYKYSNVNIVFDEVELYFHPEMQRTYISDLLSAINKMEYYDGLNNLNILFITHSPFILSDIPVQNVMHLELDKNQKAIQGAYNNQTFGANIHDMLAKDFFLKKGFMGEFAKNKINEVVISMKIKIGLDYALKEENKRFRKDSTKLDYLRKHFSGFEDVNKIMTLSKEDCKKVISLVGEPMLYMSLMELYSEAFTDTGDDFIENQINKLKKLKKA